MTNIPPLPVIRDFGGYSFVHPDGTFSCAVKVGNERLYARDFRDSVNAKIEESLQEPNEFEFISMLEKQGNQNGRRRKNTRNQHRGKRKAL